MTALAILIAAAALAVLAWSLSRRGHRREAGADGGPGTFSGDGDASGPDCGDAGDGGDCGGGDGGGGD